MSGNMLKFIINKRFWLLVIYGIAVYAAVNYLHIPLWYVVIGGIITGIIFGKVFCRWACPIGIVMEIMMGASKDDKFSAMYQYHKTGCPIAWVSGWLNKYSLFKINLNEDSCKNCGVCDKKCYMVTVEPEKYSLYKKDKQRPGESYSCSKCLECVAACPAGSLKYNIESKKR